jgi:hypothetical protein
MILAGSYRLESASGSTGNLVVHPFFSSSSADHEQPFWDRQQASNGCSARYNGPQDSAGPFRPLRSDYEREEQARAEAILLAQVESKHAKADEHSCIWGIEEGP